jgi:hypothetical protein
MRANSYSDPGEGLGRLPRGRGRVKSWVLQVSTTKKGRRTFPMERKVYVKQEGDGGWCFRIFWQLCTRQKWSCLDLSLRAVDCCAEEVKFALVHGLSCHTEHCR